MSLPLILACVWALVATGTALLPMRLQMIPGATLLITAPILLVWIGIVHGGWVVAAATVGFLSMFRRPLFYLARRAMGHKLPPPHLEGKE